MLRRIYFIGFTGYIVMFVLSILFYQERSILTDSSFDLFYLLKGNNFDLNAVRFSGIIPKLIPYFAIKAGLPLNSVLISYSISFIAYHFLCYIVCGSIIRSYQFAIVILICNILFVAQCFYYIPSELPLGISFLMVAFAFLSKMHANIHPLICRLLVALLVVVAAFFHPLMVFVVAFAFVFFILHRDIPIERPMLYFLTALFYIAVALKTLLIRTQYEQHSMSGLKNFVTLFPGYFNIYSNKQFLLHCFTRYYWIPLATAAIARHYKSHREWRKLVFFCFSVCGYLLLVNISYPTPVTPSFYIENLYLPVGVFLALPFVFDLLPALLIRQSALPVFILILISGCIRLYTSHTIFTRRLDLEREIIARYGSRKVILDAKNVDTNALQMLWGTPYECLLLSVSDHHPPASIIIDGNPDIRIYDGTHNNALVVNYNIVPYRDLNPRYFKFTDTSTIYAIIHNE